MEYSCVVITLVVVALIVLSFVFAKLDMSNRDEISPKNEEEAREIFDLVRSLVDKNGVIETREEPGYSEYNATCHRLGLGSGYYLYVRFCHKFHQDEIWVCYKGQDITVHSYNVRKKMEKYIKSIINERMKSVLN